MHSFLRSIGFSEDSITERELEKLLDSIATSYDHMLSVAGDSVGTIYVEAGRHFGPKMGITVTGEMSADHFRRLSYFPYLRSSRVTSEEEVALQLRADGESFAGICDDGRVGVPLIFALQNPGDYRRELRFGRAESMKITTTLTGMSLGGMIVLPVKQPENPGERQEMLDRRAKIVAEAKKGDERALQILTLQDIAQYNRVEARLKEEDVLSIVESYLMPFGMESDRYRILGTIMGLSTVHNTYTKESVRVMRLDVNGLIFDVCINSMDLYGEPAVGRRFKGNIWLQGRLNFTTAITQGAK